MSEASISFKDEGYTSPDFLTNVALPPFSCSRNHSTAQLASQNCRPPPQSRTDSHRPRGRRTKWVPSESLTTRMSARAGPVARCFAPIRPSMRKRCTARSIDCFSKLSYMEVCRKRNWMPSGVNWRHLFPIPMHLTSYLTRRRSKGTAKWKSKRVRRHLQPRQSKGHPSD